MAQKWKETFGSERGVTINRGEFDRAYREMPPTLCVRVAAGRVCCVDRVLRAFTSRAGAAQPFAASDDLCDACIEAVAAVAVAIQLGRSRGDGTDTG